MNENTNYRLKLLLKLFSSWMV